MTIITGSPCTLFPPCSLLFKPNLDPPVRTPENPEVRDLLEPGPQRNADGDPAVRAFRALRLTGLVFGAYGFRVAGGGRAGRGVVGRGDGVQCGRFAGFGSRARVFISGNSANASGACQLYPLCFQSFGAQPDTVP